MSKSTSQDQRSYQRRKDVKRRHPDQQQVYASGDAAAPTRIRDAVNVLPEEVSAF